MFNKVVLVGNLTKDIELRYSQSGSCIGNSSIAVTRKYTSTQGQKAEETCFIDLTFFGKTAEIANQYLSKGSKLLVEGRLKFEQWQDNYGNNRSKHSISVENIEMLGNPNTGNDMPPSKPTKTYTKSPTQNNAKYVDDDVSQYTDDEIPF